MTASLTCAHYNSPIAQSYAVCANSEEEVVQLTLQHREKENDYDMGEPLPKSIVLIPEVTMQGNTLHFITPCYGCEFRLVQGDVVCYSTEINGDILTIPASLHGTYELQIVANNYIYYCEVTLN